MATPLETHKAETLAAEIRTNQRPGCGDCRYWMGEAAMLELAAPHLQRTDFYLLWEDLWHAFHHHTRHAH